MQLNKFYNVFKSSGEPTYNSDNEKFHHSKFAWYAKRSSLADINPKSHYLIAFNLLNPLLYVYLHALNVEFFLCLPGTQRGVHWQISIQSHII